MLNRGATWDSQQAMLSPVGGFTFHGMPTGEDMVLYVSVRGYRLAVDTPGYAPRYREMHLRVPAGTLKTSVPVALVPAGDAAFTLRVSGTPGTKFDGLYLVQSPSQSEGFPVNGVVPAEYKATTETLSVRLRKLSDTGALKVEILKAGLVVASSETSALKGTAEAFTR